MTVKNLCIYHASCADGFAAAAVVKLSMDKIGATCEFLPAHYGDEAPDVTGRHVFIVDFSYPREVLIEMKEQADCVHVFDHHKTAEAACEGLEFCHFDMNHCGAVLTWFALFPEDPLPVFLQYIQDRDLWNWHRPNSKEFSAGLQLLENDLDLWIRHMFNEDLFNNLIDCGVNVLEYQEQCVQKQVKRAYTTTIDGYDVPTINATHLISEIGNELAKGQPFAAMYFDTEDKRIYSLRSDKNGLDCSEIAAKFGGGGHFHAAGFSVPNYQVQLGLPLPII